MATTAKMFRVFDPRHVYPIRAVECLALNFHQAKQLALEAMTGTDLDSIDSSIVMEMCRELVANEMNVPKTSRG